MLQIYSQTDGSYMGSPEMSPLYSIVNALTQTAAAIILIHAAPLLLSFCISLSFLSSSRLLPLSRINLLSFLYIPHPIPLLSNTGTLTHASTHTHTQLTLVKAL